MNTKPCANCDELIQQKPHQNDGTFARIKLCDTCKPIINKQKAAEYARNRYREKVMKVAKDRGTVIWWSSIEEKRKPIVMEKHNLDAFHLFISPGLAG